MTNYGICDTIREKKWRYGQNTAAEIRLLFYMCYDGSGGESAPVLFLTFRGLYGLSYSQLGFSAFAASLGMTPDQQGMKLGVLVGMLFPLAAVFLYYRLWKGRQD